MTKSERRVRTMIAAGVPFSLECMVCDGVASGDGIRSIEQAMRQGWTAFQPAPKYCNWSNFWGLCPEHVKSETELPAIPAGYGKDGASCETRFRKRGRESLTGPRGRPKRI